MVFDKIGDMFGDFDVGKIKDVVEDFWEDREKILDAVNFVWDNRDALGRLIGQLPEMLGSTGDAIESAGGSAIQAAALLTGDKPGSTSVASLSSVAADALSGAAQQVESVGGLLESIIGNSALSDMGDNLKNVGDQIRALGAQIADAGGDLDRVGHQLTDSGQTLAKFAEWGP